MLRILPKMSKRPLLLLDKNRYDVIITDIIMPRTSGVEFLEMIRKRSSTIQVIIITGDPTVETCGSSCKKQRK